LGLEKLDRQGLAREIGTLAQLPIAARANYAKADPERARTLPAGAIILAGLQELLRVPLRVADGGVREGVCLGLLEAEAATG